MAGPFHHHLRRDAAGKGETNEGAAAGVGANHLVFRKSLFDTLASTVAGPGEGLIEAGKLAEVFQVPVHQLVCQNRQRTAIRIFLVLVFLQDGFGKAVQVDGQSVVGLYGGHIHRVVFNVRPL